MNEERPSLRHGFRLGRLFSEVVGIGIHCLPSSQITHTSILQVNAQDNSGNRCASKYLLYLPNVISEKSQIHTRRYIYCIRTTQVDDLAIWMEKRQAKRQKTTPTRTKTPEPKNPVIGSSCTWRGRELSEFKVVVQRDVDPKQMVPPKFFAFDHLAGYEQCIRVYLRFTC